MLLTNVSGRQAALVLTDSSDASQSMSTFVANLTPSESLPKTEPVRVLDAPAFAVQPRRAIRRPAGTLAAGADLDEVVAAYLQQMQRDDGPRPITVALRLVLADTEALAAIHTAYAVQVAVQVDPAVFETGAEFALQSVARDRESSGDFELVLHAKEAVACTVELAVEFTANNQLVYQSTLRPLPITYGDFLCPLQLSGAALTAGTYTALWRQLAAMLGRESGHLFSTRSMSVTYERATRAIRDALEPLVVVGTFNETEMVFPFGDADSKTEASAFLDDKADPILSIKHVAAVIPRNSHVLFTLYVRQSTLTVSVLSDNWRVVPAFDEYMDALFSA